MSGHNLQPRWPVVGFEHESPGSRGMEAIRSRTPDSVRQRIREHARTLRNDNFAVGVEILPTHLVAVLTDPTGQHYGQRRRDLPEMSVDTVVREIGTVVNELVWTSLGVDPSSRRIAVGLQIGGPVDARAGIVRSWRNYHTESRFAARPVQWTTPVPLAALVEEETGCPTVVENDAAAYAAYELRFGAGFQTGSFAIILVRDGVGGGIVMDHRVLSIPFEIGHLNVRKDGRKCACGNVGCVEAHAGRRAIRGLLGELLRRPTDADDIRAAIELASSGADPRVLDVFRAAGEAIAHAIATVLTLFGVDRVVIFCDPEMCDQDKPPVAAFSAGVATFQRYTFPPYRNCEIERKEWHSTDGALGAALVALNQLFFVPLAFAEPVA